MARKISKDQREIYRYLRSFYLFTIILDDHQIIKPFDLDIFIPFYRLAIEYDGEYWHYSDWAVKNGSLKLMAKKEKICVKNNIKLLRIRESEWNANKEIEFQKIIDFIEAGRV